MPGKIEMSFQQWYHEVQCVKDHYQESVVRQSIVCSWKGTAADMAQYMGTNASVAHILQKMTITYSTVALFNILMQNFYKVTQRSQEGSILCQEVGRDPQPNKVTVPQKDHGLRSVTAPQGPSLSWGM